MLVAEVSIADSAMRDGLTAWLFWVGIALWCKRGRVMRL